MDPTTDPQPAAQVSPDIAEPPKIKRAHQACLNCRKRKSRCLLYELHRRPIHFLYADY